MHCVCVCGGGVVGWGCLHQFFISIYCIVDGRFCGYRLILFIPEWVTVGDYQYYFGAMEDEVYYDDARKFCDSLKDFGMGNGKNTKLFQPVNDDEIELLYSKIQLLNITSFDVKPYYIFVNFQRRQENNM